MAVRRITLSLIAVVCFAVFLAVPAAAQFTQSDLAGGWIIQGAETSTRIDSPGGWVIGSVGFDDEGLVIGGVVTNNRGEQTQLDSGSVTLQANGHLEGTIGNNESTIVVRGRLLPTKQVIIAVTSADQESSNPTYTLVALTKSNVEQFQFTQGDLTGTWRTASLLIPELPAPQPETLAGAITFDGQGISSGTLRSSNASTDYAVGGQLFVSSTGQVAGGLQITVSTENDFSTFVGFMSPDKSLLVGTITRDRLNLVQNGILVLQRQAAPAAPFTSASLVGPWELLSLQAHIGQGNVGEWHAGNITVDAQGRITGSLTGPGGEDDAIVDLDDGESNMVTIDGNGTVTGNIVTELRRLTFQGAMNAAKDRIGGADTLEADEDDNVSHVGVFALLRGNAATPPPASIVRFRSTTLSPRVTEGATTALIVERTGATTTQVTVDYQVTGGTATLGSDFNVVAGNLTSPTGTLTFPAGMTTHTINVVALTDTLVETDETVIIGLSNPTNGATLPVPPALGRTATVTIGDSAAVQFQQPIYTVKENVPSLVVTAVRTGSSTTPFSVTYTAIPITAVRDVDFKLVPPGALTFAAGVMTRTFSVTILNNTLVDGNRSFTLALGTPTNGVRLGSPATTDVTITDEDQPGVIKVDKTAYTVAESAGTLAIIVRRTGTSLAGNVTVDYATDALTASDEGDPRDFTSTGGTLTFKAGETMKTVSVPILKDKLVDGPKTFEFRLFNPSSGAQLPEATASALVTITDVDLPGVIKFVPDKYSVSEAPPAGATDRTVTLTVKRTGGLGGGVLVDYTTKNGTAVGGDGGDGTDFVHKSGTLTFGFGNTSATITITIRQDTLAEGNETFTVVLSNARAGTRDLPAVLPALGSIATVTIVDDESAFQFSAPTFNAKEGTPTALITVLRTGTLTTPASVTYTASPGTAEPGVHFTPVSNLLTFPANVASKTFTVPILNNTRLDGARTVSLALGSPTGGAQLGTQRTATLNIDDNEQAGVFKLDKVAYTVLESAGFVPVTVMRTGLNLTGNVSVTLVATDATAQNGTNYSLPPTTLVFGAGETAKTVKVTILRDFLVTGAQTFTLGLTEPSSGATVAAGGPATVNITEADAAGSVKFSAAIYAVNESAGDAVVTLTRTGGTAGGVTVRVSTQDGSATVAGGDYSGIDQLVTFAAGNTSATVRIPISPDTVSEDDKSFLVKLALPSSNQSVSGLIIGAPSTAAVTIMDDDTSMVQFNGSFIGNFPVIARDGNVKRVVVVDFETAEGGTAIPGVDFTPVRGTITFAANTQATTIPLVIFNDTIAEGFETFTYRLTNPRGARLGLEAQKTFIITDNDFGGSNIQFTAPTFTGTEGQTVTLTVVRTGGLGSSLEVPWTAGEGSATPGTDFTPASGVLTFATNSLTASFTITLLNDNLIEGTETVPITLNMPDAAATLGAQSTATLQIQDVAPPASVVQFTTATFSAVNDQNKAITLVRSGALGSQIVINWTATGGTAAPGEDFSPTSGTVTFGPSDTTASFLISTREGGGSGDPDVTVVFGISVASGVATIGAVNTATLTILGSASDLNLDFSVYSVTEGGGPAIITVTRRGNVNRAVSVDFATSNGTAVAGTHYTARSGRLTVPVNAATATFTIPILSNGPGDGTRTVNLTLSNPSPNTTLGEGDSARLEIRESPAYTFTLIAQTDDEVFAFEGTPGINDAGKVAFKARALIQQGQEQEEQQQILTGSGGDLSLVAATGQNFVDFGSRTPIDNNGLVTFLATKSDELGQAIFRGDEEEIGQILSTGGLLIGLFDPAVSGNGNVVFAGQFDTAPGTGVRLFRRTGGGATTLLPGTDGSLFTNIGIHPAINDGGFVAFVANSEPGRGIYSLDANGDPVVVADDVDVATFTSVSFNNGGRVAFIPGSGNIRQSVLFAPATGGITPFATAADGFQNFGEVNTDDNSPVINDRGDVAFFALTQAGSEGILTGRNPVANTAIQVGDPLFGSTVAFLTFGGINAAGRIVFRATLLDGREVVAVAAPPATVADLAVTKTVNNPTPLVGSNVTFTVTARNNGPAGAGNIVVTDQLPGSLAFVSAVPSQGTYTSGTGVWTVGTLAANATATLLITATVQSGSPATNTASISASGVSDPNAANNTASATVTPAQQADIAVTKTANTPNPVIGSNVIFTVTATNNGPAAATNIQVTDQLPTGFTFVSSLASQGNYTTGSGVWAVPSLAVGANATLQITASVKPSGVYSNTATRTASTPVDSNAANDSATATVTPVSGIALTTDGPLVGVGRTINGTAAIPTPAPAGGVTITLTANPIGLINLAPSTVTINQGQISAPFTVSGVAAGTTTITGAATGFGNGTLAVTVTSSVISLGTLPALGPGQAVSLPISLSTPAPAGGLTVSFSSTNTSVVTVTPSVSIAQGSVVPATNPQVTGVGIGTAQINAAAIGFASDSRPAGVAVNVTFSPTTLNVVVGASTNITVNVSAPAPASGLTFNLSTANASVATVVSPVTVQAGQTSVQASVTGRAVASTTIQASGGGGVTSTPATINVTQPPTITLGPQTIGKDLQVPTSVFLGAAAPAGGASVTLTSSDATKLRLAASGTVAGTGQLTVQVGAGSSSSPVVIQALDSTGSVTVTMTATGYQTSTSTMTLAPSGFAINSPGNFTTTTLSNPTSVQMLPYRLNPGTLTLVTNQTVRGGLTVNVPVTATDQTGGPGVGTIATSPVVFQGGDTFGTTTFVPGAAGTSLIALGTPTGFSTPANTLTPTATVTAPTITLSPQTIGKDLEVSVGLSLGAPAPQNALPITVTSSDPTKLLVAASGTVAGTANGSLTFTVNQGATSTPAIWLQALDSTGTVTVTVSAPGFQTSTSTTTLVPSGFVINTPGSFTTTTLSNPTTIQVLPYRLTPGTLTLVTNQTVRGGLTVNVPVTATDQTGGPGVGVITASPLVFIGGDTFKQTTFDPAVAGTSLIALGTPTGFSTPANAPTPTATVTAPTITLSPQTIGKDLEVSVGLSLGAPAPQNALPITVTSSDPTKLLVAASGTVAGSANGSLTFTVNQGAFSTPAIWLQALDSTGTVTVTVSAPGFQTSTSTMTLTPSGFAINTPGSFTTTTFSTPTTIQALPYRLTPGTLTLATNQTVRGGLTVNVPVTATDQTGGPGVGVITASPLVFIGGDTFKQTTFDPAVAGTSLIALGTPTGFSTPANAPTPTATVTAPAITFSATNIQVGRDLQQQFSVTLGATPPSPVTVTVKVASTAIATITTDGTVAGGDTVTFTNVTSTFAGNFFVQGRAATGATALSAKAAGFADGASTVTAQPSGFIINSPGNFTTTAGAGNSNIQILSVRLNPTTLNTEVSQVVRGGVTVSVPVTATTLTGSGVGAITTSPVIFNANANAVSTQFDPAAAGTAAIAVGLPTGFDRPSDRQQITVTVNP